MRMKNKNVDQKKMISNVYKKIIDKNLERNKEKSKYTPGDYSFVDYIRNYAGKLDIEKNKLLKKAGVNKDDFYNLIMRKEDKEKLIKYITKEFLKIIK